MYCTNVITQWLSYSMATPSRPFKEGIGVSGVARQGLLDPWLFNMDVTRLHPLPRAGIVDPSDRGPREPYLMSREVDCEGHIIQ